jgi:glycosyltransferase involved in cell wall biosynthesis
MESPRVSVIVCTHDHARFELLRAAVASVQDQDPLPRELIVVVDHNDSLLDRVRSEISGPRVMANANQAGLSGARNTGVLAASGEVVAFIDDDASAAPGWIAALLAGYVDRSVLGVGGVAAPAWESAQPSWFPDEFLWVVGCSYRGLPTEAEPVRNLIGCNMSFRRTLFAEVGGFHEGIGRGRGLPLGCEETELCIRGSVRFPQGRYMLQPAARVDHVVPARRGRLGYFLQRSYAEGISKAYVVRLVGAQHGLATERRYARATLTRGVGRGLADAVRGNPRGLGRAGAILIGLIVFGVGYVRGSAMYRPDRPYLDRQAAARPDE